MIGIFRQNHDDEALLTPNAEVLPGQIVELADGRAAINNSNNSILAGQTGVVRTHGIIEVTKGSALVFADGADVFIASAAIATAVGAGFYLGQARRGGAGDGDTKLFVALNAPTLWTAPE